MASKKAKQPILASKRTDSIPHRETFTTNYCMCTSAEGWVESKETGKTECELCGKEVWFCPNCKKGVMKFSKKENVWFECAFCGSPIDMLTKN